MRIRPLRPSDAAALAPLCAQLSVASTPAQLEERLRQLEEAPLEGLFGAEGEEGALLGWVQVQGRLLLEAGAFAEVVSLVVDETVRSQGIGRALLERGEAWAREHGFTRMRLRSNVKRERAHRFYLRLGYAITKSQHVFEKPL